jgi:hypothetical protein
MLVERGRGLELNTVKKSCAEGAPPTMKTSFQKKSTAGVGARISRGKPSPYNIEKETSL